MSQSWMHFAAAGMVLVPLIGISHAQLPPGHDAWLMQNYRFTGPPPPGEVRPAADPLSEIREVQSTVRFIMRQAEFEGDYRGSAGGVRAGRSERATDPIDHRASTSRPSPRKRPKPFKPRRPARRKRNRPHPSS